MKKFRFLALAAAAGLLCAAQAQAESQKITLMTELTQTEEWTGDDGSAIKGIKVDTNASTFSGTYTNTKLPECKSLSVPVTGWINGETLTFTAVATSGPASCQGLTAWTGYYVPAARDIYTEFDKVVYKRGTKSTVTSGKATFHRVASQKSAG